MKYQTLQPQRSASIFLTDGGIETTLIFLEKQDFPMFAAFVLLKTDEGRASLLKYFHSYATLAQRLGEGIILETATWRASLDWGGKLGYSREELAELNRQAVAMLMTVREQYEGQAGASPIVVSGCVGPRGDGYSADAMTTTAEAAAYHEFQVNIFAAAGVDLVTAITMTYVEEALGVCAAAKKAHMPCVISFTVEVDGKLPSGQLLKEAILQVEAAFGAAGEALNEGLPLYYMLNCAHPDHFAYMLLSAAASGEKWVHRIGGLRCNASKKSHAELDEATELDEGNPGELGFLYRALRNMLPKLTVVGGCCGTDVRHVEAIHNKCMQ